MRCRRCPPLRWRRRDSVFRVVGLLHEAPPDVSSSATRIDSVTVSAYMMTRPSTLRAARPTFESRPCGPQEPLFIGVENRDERHLRQVQSFAKQVDANEHIELAETQVAQNLDALERFDL